MATWFTYDADDGFHAYETEEKAKAAAEFMLKLWRDTARNDDEWPEEVEQLCYGVLTGEVERVVSYDDSDTDVWDYKLMDAEQLAMIRREERAMDALMVAAMRGIDLSTIPRTREERLESLLSESLRWLNSYKCGEGDQLIQRITDELKGTDNG